ncbi:MAG: putative toxin-antitoxin system toxin component, PIN family [Chloroflexota bacterium]|nr:putative toxin-antitoxin system toxin component, PIN family [Chloroflexota bacterium]
MKLWQTLMRLFARSGRKNPRVVLDTNVLVSATIIRLGAPGRIIAAVLDDHITLIVSDQLLTEYLDVMQRPPHILRKFDSIAARIQTLSVFLRNETIRVEGSPSSRIVPDDPKDDFIIAAAVEGKARYIVSGDEHLLNLRQYRGIKILTPRDFVVNVLGENVATPR